VRDVRPILVLATVACAAGCSKQVAPVTPAVGPAMVAAAFMQAVADSNLAQMAALWGTERGPAAATNVPTNWGQRISIMHAYLKGGASRVLGEGDPALNRDNRRQVLIELNRGGCIKTVPFTMIRTRDGAWIVNAVDLNAAGVPGMPCAKPASGTPPAGSGFIR
jgi:hypothetical protein